MDSKTLKLDEGTYIRFENSYIVLEQVGLDNKNHPIVIGWEKIDKLIEFLKNYKN